MIKQNFRRSILPNIPIADDGLTYQACTNLVSGSTEVTRVNGAAAFLALALFLIYFYFQATSLSLLGSVIPVLFVQDATTNHNPTKTSTNLNSHIAYAMRAYQGCKFVILICVEVVGLWMIFNSTSNHEVIINSTAAFFLCELDAYLLNCIVQKYLLVEPISGEYDVELINIEFSTGDIGPYFEQLKKKRNEQQSNATNEVIENQSSENPIVTSA